MILTSILNCPRVDLYARELDLSMEQKDRYDRMLQRRANGEPLQYILGQCDFMGIQLDVDARVLIPRPETELLVELAIRELKTLRFGRPLRILDLGTGSGNVAIALAQFIDRARITSVDISSEAIEVARRNAAVHDVEHRIHFIREDMVHLLQHDNPDGPPYDLIISNPPYIKTSHLASLPRDVQREPVIALDGGEDGLYFYRQIIEKGPRFLERRGLLLMEIGDGQGPAIEEIFHKNKYYSNVRFEKDYTNIDRIVAAYRKDVLWGI